MTRPPRYDNHPGKSKRIIKRLPSGWLHSASRYGGRVVRRPYRQCLRWYIDNHNLNYCVTAVVGGTDSVGLLSAVSGILNPRICPFAAVSVMSPPMI